MKEDEPAEEEKEIKILKKRLRDENNNPYGMVIAINKDQLGYSICHSKMDKYDDEKAFKIAVSRARSHKDTNADFWIKTRKRSLEKNPIREALCVISSNDFLESCIFNCNADCYSREMAAFRELVYMEERAKRYYKE